MHGYLTRITLHTLFSAISNYIYTFRTTQIYKSHIIELFPLLTIVLHPLSNSPSSSPFLFCVVKATRSWISDN